MERIKLQCYFDCRLCSKHNKPTLIQKLLVCIQKQLINMNIKNLKSTQGRAATLPVWRLKFKLHWRGHSIDPLYDRDIAMCYSEDCVLLEALHYAKRVLRKTAWCWVELIAVHCRSWMLGKLPMLQGLCAGEANLCWKTCQAEHIWTRNKNPCILQCVFGAQYSQSSTLCLLLRAQLNFFRASNEGKFEVEGQ